MCGNDVFPAFPGLVFFGFFFFCLFDRFSRPLHVSSGLSCYSLPHQPKESYCFAQKNERHEFPFNLPLNRRPQQSVFFSLGVCFVSIAMDTLPYPTYLGTQQLYCCCCRKPVSGPSKVIVSLPRVRASERNPSQDTHVVHAPPPPPPLPRSLQSSATASPFPSLVSS